MSALAPLRARARWNAASEVEQDAAIAAIAAALRAEVEHVETAWFGPAERAHRLGVFRHRSAGVQLHLLPGEPDLALGRAGAGALPQEGPARRAAVGPCLAGRFPLLAGEWARVPGFGRPPAGTPDDLPVAGVSWEGARAWLAAAGGGLRLPREAEWEHACRAGDASAWWWGEAFDPARCWALEQAGGRPRRVSEHAGQDHPFGLIDLAGNVSEWCEDDHDAPMEGSAWHEHDPGKAHRGGSFASPPACCRSAWRAGADPRRPQPSQGLRAFRSVPDL